MTVAKPPLLHRIRALATTATVLHVGAHPDDEEGALIATLATGSGAQVVYWSATRGEGGQNRASRHQGVALGIVRTWESVAARGIDGGEVLYGPFIDFGFCKTAAAALDRWGRDALIGEIVRAMRWARPQVIVTRWVDDEAAGHGAHRAVGWAVMEAFEAAGDTRAFPEHLSLGLSPWQPLKLYRSMAGDWQPGEERAAAGPHADADALLVDVGRWDPVTGRSADELATLGLNLHRTQGMGQVPERGERRLSYRLLRSLVPTGPDEDSFFDGLDLTLPSWLGPLPPDGELAAVLTEAQDAAEAAVAAYRIESPEGAAPLLIELGTALRRARMQADGDGYAGLRRRLDDRIAATDDAVLACLGVDVRCDLDRARVLPGDSLSARTRVVADGAVPVTVADVRLRTRGDWTVHRIQAPTAEAASTTVAVDRVVLPRDTGFTTPYWLRSQPDSSRYRWAEDTVVGTGLDPPNLEAEVTLEICSHAVTVCRPAAYREGFPGGYRELGPAVLPPVDVRAARRRELLIAGAGPDHIDVGLTLRATAGPASGTVGLSLPPPWSGTDAPRRFVIERAGRSTSVRFDLRVPDPLPPGRYHIGLDVTTDDGGAGLQVEDVRIGSTSGEADADTCVAEAFVITPPAVIVDAVDAEFVPDLRYAYVKAFDDGMAESLHRLPVNVSVLDVTELDDLDAEAYDAIVVGPNAYLAGEAGRRNAERLLSYVAAGGTLIVQYQGYGYQAEGLAPYPFRYNEPHDRVTLADAPVDVLEPDHPVLTMPNRLSPADFDGWHHDRGLYFFGEWDRRYQPLVASADPGEAAKRGGLLIAPYGRGTYVYVALSLFRQVPAGVSGAVRLLANILAIPEARVRERTTVLAGLPLFSLLSPTDLRDVARICTERWVAAGEVLCRRGEVGDELFVVTDGVVDVLRDDGTVADRVGAGEVVGELAVLADRPRSATLRAGDDVKLIAMRGAHLRRLLHGHPEMAEALLRILATRFGEARR